MDITQEAMAMRQQGLPDAMIAEELGKKGIHPQLVQNSLSAMNDDVPTPGGMPPVGGNMSSMNDMPPMGRMPPIGSSPAPQGNIYDRIEEITESAIDEKWDDLLVEVRKIVAWKDQLEEKQVRMEKDLEILKDSFKTLHSGVLGKLETYDDRMQDVGTELQAVGKVFKDVIPEFVENVKELSFITKGMKK